MSKFILSHTEKGLIKRKTKPILRASTLSDESMGSTVRHSSTQCCTDSWIRNMKKALKERH